jgi:RND family efflux transporter MFP subunit
MRIQASTVWAFVALAPIAAGASWLALHGRDATAAPARQAERKAGLQVKVRVVRPEKGGLPWSVTRPASIHAFHRAALYAKASGYLQNQVVDIGDAVEKGALLAEVYAPEIVAAVQKAKADVAKAEAMVNVAQAHISEANSELTESRAALEQTKAQLINAAALLKLRQEQYDRIARLAKEKAIQEELVDEKFEARDAAQAAQLAAEKAVATAEAAVATAQARLARSKADLSSSEAEVQVAKAALAEASALEQYTHIRSPYKGVITERNFHDGDFIRDAASGATQPVFGVAETDVMRVIVWVPDEDVPFTHRGIEASLQVDALDGRVFKGVVARTAMSENYETRTMRTEIDLENSEGLLKDGMFGAATIQLGRKQDAVSIPTACLLGDGKEERAVYLVRDGRARRVEVRVGRDDGIQAEVLSGLTTDDQVIEEHGPGLDDDVLVTVVSTKSESKSVKEDVAAGEETDKPQETGKHEKK